MRIPLFLAGALLLAPPSTRAQERRVEDRAAGLAVTLPGAALLEAPASPLRVDPRSAAEVREIRRGLRPPEPSFRVLEHDLRVDLFPAQRRLAVRDDLTVLWNFFGVPLPNELAEGASTLANLLCLERTAGAAAYGAASAQEEDEVLRAGMIGLDTSHVVAFTRILNDPRAAPEVAGCRVVAAFPGRTELEEYKNRVPGFRAELAKMGVEIVGSIAELLERVDVVLLETVDGRPHLEQALPVLAAGKPLFVDKPVAGSLADAVRLYEEAARRGTPVFSSSSLRYLAGAQRARAGEYGAVLGCEAYSPCPLEPHHPDLFWYGIHGVETLFTAMGPGCERVVRVHSPGADVVVGSWRDGRLGTFRGIRDGKHGYGGTVFGSKNIAELGPYEGYRGLVVEIVRFFRTGLPPVSPEETLEIYAFMAAADESKRRGGAPVTLPEVLEQARPQPGKKDSREAPGTGSR